MSLLYIRLCGQDTIRSVVFGLCSLLMPAGYSGDSRYYQRPRQPLTRRGGGKINQDEEEDSTAIGMLVRGFEGARDKVEGAKDKLNKIKAAKVFNRRQNSQKEEDQTGVDEQEAPQQNDIMTKETSEVVDPSVNDPPVVDPPVDPEGPSDHVVLDQNGEEVLAARFLFLYTFWNLLLTVASAGYDDDNNQVIYTQCVL